VEEEFSKTREPGSVVEARVSFRLSHARGAEGTPEHTLKRLQGAVEESLLAYESTTLRFSYRRPKPFTVWACC
jgi:hypothetical protein